MSWPATWDELARAQEQVARRAVAVDPWDPRPGYSVGGCFVCFDAEDRAYAAAALLAGRLTIAVASVSSPAPAPYVAGRLALREGNLLETAVRRLPRAPDVLLVNATGRDHPRRAGLAVHLGAVLDVATVGVTSRPLLATGEFGVGPRGTSWPVELGGEEVGRWVVTRAGTRPVVAHPGWRTSLDTAVALVLATATRARTPEPVRRARQMARRARTGSRVHLAGSGESRGGYVQPGASKRS